MGTKKKHTSIFYRQKRLLTVIDTLAHRIQTDRDDKRRRATSLEIMRIYEQLKPETLDCNVVGFALENLPHAIDFLVRRGSGYRLVVDHTSFGKVTFLMVAADVNSKVNRDRIAMWKILKASIYACREAGERHFGYYSRFLSWDQIAHLLTEINIDPQAPCIREILSQNFSVYNANISNFLMGCRMPERDLVLPDNLVLFDQLLEAKKSLISSSPIDGMAVSYHNNQKSS